MIPDDLELRSLPGLWQEYASTARTFAFQPGGSMGKNFAWQQRLRAELVRLMGISTGRTCDLSPQVVGTTGGDDFTQQLVMIQTAPGEYMPVHVLVPHRPAAKPFRPVIALHGHGTWGGKAIIQNPDDPLGAELNQQLNYDYAGQLARRGYLVFVPELRGLGLRLEDVSHRLEVNPKWISSCYAVGVNALMLGKTLPGLHVLDVMRLVDYIETYPETSIEGLGCAGLSTGGMLTLFSTALDQRITCAVVSGYLNTFRDSIMSIRHCLCNVVPGLARVAEMVDIAGLLAPRPLLIESGEHDAIFPIDAARRTYTQLQEIYRAFHAEDKLDIDIFDGEHSWSGAKAYAWFDRWLRTAM